MNDVGKQEHKEKKAAVILAAGSGRRIPTLLQNTAANI